MPKILTSLPARGARPRHEVELVHTSKARRELYALRRQIYVEEMGIVAEDHPYVQDHGLVDPFDDHSFNLLLRIDGRPAGSVRITCSSDGPLEIDKYTNASATCPDPAHSAEVTRLMVLQEHRGGPAGPLLLYGMWQLLRALDVRYMLVAGKHGSLGRYYKNICAFGLEIAPGDFTYGLTGCRYELLVADIGRRGSLRRLVWRAHMAGLALLTFGMHPLGRAVLHRGKRRRLARSSAAGPQPAPST